MATSPGRGVGAPPGIHRRIPSARPPSRRRPHRRPPATWMSPAALRRRARDSVAGHPPARAASASGAARDARTVGRGHRGVAPRSPGRRSRRSRAAPAVRSSSERAVTGPGVQPFTRPFTRQRPMVPTTIGNGARRVMRPSSAPATERVAPGRALPAQVPLERLVRLGQALREIGRRPLLLRRAGVEVGVVLAHEPPVRTLRRSRSPTRPAPPARRRPCGSPRRRRPCAAAAPTTRVTMALPRAGSSGWWPAPPPRAPGGVARSPRRAPCPTSTPYSEP